jgi:methanogenic corrinoid protein MtbC1
VTEERQRKILKGLHDAVVEFEEERVAELAQAAPEESVDAYEVLMDGLAAGMEMVGQLHNDQVYFVPEVLLCSDAPYAGLHIPKPHIKREKVAMKGQVVLGTVEGEVHDIGWARDR